jgi:protocatechuate 3,4-dioxygenase beta subunit
MEVIMSRSRRKKPILGAAGYSERSDKKMWHRRFRAHENSLLRGKFIDYDAMVMPVPREIIDVWNMAKDGKYYNWLDEKLLDWASAPDENLGEQDYRQVKAEIYKIMRK